MSAPRLGRPPTWMSSSAMARVVLSMVLRYLWWCLPRTLFKRISR